MNKLQVFLDGACHLCHFESRIIQKADTENLIQFINISSPSFTRSQYPARNYDRYLQARKPNGDFVQGIEAFSEIYKLLPKYRWIGHLLATPILRELAWIPYFAFAHLRKWLPKRKSCEL